MGDGFILVFEKLNIQLIKLMYPHQGQIDFITKSDAKGYKVYIILKNF